MYVSEHSVRKKGKIIYAAFSLFFLQCFVPVFFIEKHRLSHLEFVVCKCFQFEHVQHFVAW